MELKYTANRYYFKYEKTSTLLRRIGFTLSGFALVAVMLFVSAAIISGIFAVCFLLVSEELNESDDEVENQVLRETDRLCTELEMKHWDVLRPYPRMIVSSIGNFVTEGEGLMFRRGKDRGKLYTSRYHAVAVGLKERRLYYSGERYSLIDENDFSATGGEYDFTELDRADYRRADGAAIPHFEFALFTRSGEEAFRVPAQNDWTTQKYAEDLTAVFEHARDGADTDR